MKKLKFLTLSLVFIILTSQSVFAKTGMIECSGVAGNGNDLKIYTYNSEIRGIKIVYPFEGNARPLFVHKSRFQNIENSTLFTIDFAPSSLLQVENSVIEGLEGNVRLFNQDYTCNGKF